MLKYKHNHVKGDDEMKAITEHTAFLVKPQQLIGLDQLVLNIRKQGGKKLNRSAVVRAMIDALITSTVDFTNIQSEEDLTAILKK